MNWTWSKTYYLSVIIMSIAAIVTIYFNFFVPPKPFKPEITFGSPVIKEESGILTFALGIIFSNTGGEPGCISDVALNFQSKTQKTRWTFFPAWFVDMNSYLQGLSEKRDIMFAVDGPFSPIPLTAGSTNRHSLFFMPRPTSVPKGPIPSHQDLIPKDTCIVEIHILKSADDCKISQNAEWINVSQAEFVLSEDQLKNISDGLAVIPIDLVRDNLREKFISR